jgi:hypothetical protein
MSPLVHHAIEVAATPDACWRVLSDFSTWPRWFPRARWAASLDEGSAWRVGGRFQILFDFGVDVAVKPVIEELDTVHADRKRVRWIGGGFGITGDHAYTIEAIGAGLTRVTSHEQFSGLGARFLPKAILGRLEHEAQRSLERYKAIVEGARG